MVRHTKRDRIWDASLTLASRTEPFSVADVAAECAVEDPSRRTVRDVLATMVEESWLEQRTDPEDGRAVYVPGEKLDDAAGRLTAPAE